MLTARCCCGGCIGIARSVVAPQAKPWGEQKRVINCRGRGLAFEQTVKYCGYCLHPAAATPIEGKCFRQKMLLKKPFPSITSASVADMSWMLSCCYAPKCTLLCPTWLAAKAAWGRQDLGLSLLPSTTRVFQVFLKFLMTGLGILYCA